MPWVAQVSCTLTPNPGELPAARAGRRPQRAREPHEPRQQPADGGVCGGRGRENGGVCAGAAGGGRGGQPHQRRSGQKGFCLRELRRTQGYSLATLPPPTRERQSWLRLASEHGAGQQLSARSVPARLVVGGSEVMDVRPSHAVLEAARFANEVSLTPRAGGRRSSGGGLQRPPHVDAAGGVCVCVCVCVRA